MKIAFIFVLYHTSQKDVNRLSAEVTKLAFPNYSVYFIDNSTTDKGYASGVNQGLEKAVAEGANIFVIANPDISLTNIKAKDILEGLKQFAILGFPFKQKNHTYFGGQIDPVRLSGGLISKHPQTQFEAVDFVSGSLMIVKKEVISKIGFFDESYGMYYEDVDYCRRAHVSGFTVGLNTQAAYEHYENSELNPEKQLYLFKNRFRFFWKFANWQLKIRELLRLPKTMWEERQTLLKIFKSKKILLGFLSLNASSMINKLLNFMLFIFLIRVLSPHDYGLYILVWAQVNLLSPIVDLGTTSYGLLYVEKDSEQQISHLFSLRFITSIIVFSATLLLSLFFGYDSRLMLFIFFTSFIILSNMFSGTLLITTAISQKLYLPALLSISANFVYVLITIICLLIFRNLMSIFIVIFLFYTMYGLINYISLKNQVPQLRFQINLSEWVLIIKKSYVYILISVFAGLYFKIDIFLLNFMSGKEAIGIYSSGYKFFEAFMFIAASFTTAATPIYSRLARTDKQALFKRIQTDVYLLVMVGIIISIVTYTISPWIIPHLVGAKYIDAVKVVQIVITALPFIFLTTILINTLYVLGRAPYVIYVFLVQIVINATLNFLLIPKYSFIASSYLTVLSEIINTSLFFILVYKLTHLKNNENLG